MSDMRKPIDVKQWIAEWKHEASPERFARIVAEAARDQRAGYEWCMSVGGFPADIKAADYRRGVELLERTARSAAKAATPEAQRRALDRRTFHSDPRVYLVDVVEPGNPQTLVVRVVADHKMSREQLKREIVSGKGYNAGLRITRVTQTILDSMGRPLHR